uniref:Uncharacterized protein n=1 Tax=Timema bartmani TaxID=61472 RepID=A0A7R9EYU8_9NEOP|nr:unnamed protein product [Timema bartmani]
MSEQVRAPTPAEATLTQVESEDDHNQQVLSHFKNRHSFLKSYYKYVSSCDSVEEDLSPLAGLKVIDLTRIVAGPYCTMILGDLGAEVIKVEVPGTGDEARKWGPPFVKDSKDTCYFAALNRNKKSICVNLKSKKGQELVYDLARQCDVLVENYVPGKLRQFLLDYESVQTVAPHLVYCSLTGFGPKGPYSKRPGYDVIAASMGGLLNITGPKEGEPCKVGVAVTDIATGLYAHGAIMAALLQRARTGRGQKIDCNLLSTQIACLINVGSNYLNAGLEARQKTLSDWLDILEGAPFPYGPVNNIAQVFADPHVQELGLVKQMEHPTTGTIYKVVGPPVGFSEGVNAVRLPPPMLGEHTEQVLTQLLGYSQDRIHSLKASHPCGVVSALGYELMGPGFGLRLVPWWDVHTLFSRMFTVCSARCSQSLFVQQDVHTVRLKLRKPKPVKKVQWRSGTVDNEHMNRRKSKCCCVYEKPRVFGESSSESEDEECENCHGHVERRSNSQTPPEDTASGSADNGSAADLT